MEYKVEKVRSRKRKLSVSNESGTDNSVNNGDIEDDRENYEKPQEKEAGFGTIEDGRKSTERNNENRIKRSRKRTGSTSPCPSTGDNYPPLVESPCTPPLHQEARIFPPPFAYKLLEVRVSI